MAKANVILLNSILWNLREVTKLAEKIKKHCGDVDCISWRYPLTSCSELEIFKLLQNNRNLDNYTYILELTYDRLLYLFNLFIKYLETVDSLERFRPSKNVHRPKTLSLASVLHMIWERIQALTECISRVVQEEKSEPDTTEKELSTAELGVSTSTTCTQSDVCSISLCSCCEMVQKFVTELVLEMEKILQKQDFESAISSEREIMREYLTEMTSWSAMSRWLAAIIKDFTTLSEKVEQATTSSRKLRHRLDSGEKKIKLRIEQHEEEKRRLEIRLRECEVKISQLEETLEGLIREKIQLSRDLDSKNSELTASSSQFESKIAELKRNYEKKLTDKKEKKKKKEKDSEEELKRILDIEGQKFREEERQKEELKKDISKMKEEFEALNLKTAEDTKNWQKKVHDLEGEIESLKEENLRLNSTLEEKKEKIKEYSVRIMEAFPELNGVPKPKFTVGSGLPTPEPEVGPELPTAQPEVGSELPTPEPEVGPELPTAQPEVGSELPTPEPEVGPELPTAQPEVGSELPTPEPEVGPELPTAQPEVGSELPTPEPEVGSELPTAQPEVGSELPTAQPEVGSELPTPEPEIATGNPEIDMSNQIEANKIRIELLNSENESLQRTLDKIKSLKG